LYLERGRMPNYDPSGGRTGSEGARHPSLRPELADRWRTAKRSSTASSGSSVGRPSKNAMARGEDQDQDDGELERRCKSDCKSGVHKQSCNFSVDCCMCLDPLEVSRYMTRY
jgi:hypothetical protein